MREAMPRTKIKLEHIALAVVVICGFWIRFFGAENYFYHTDELVHNFIAQGRDLKEVFARGMQEGHPPLGHFIRHYLYKIDDGIFFSRMVSITCGIVAIIAFYCGGKKTSPQSYYGLVLAMLTAFATTAVIYTVSVRNYSFFLSFMGITFYHFTAFDKTGSRRNFWLYIIFSWLCCATNFGAYMFTFALMAALALKYLSEKAYKKIFILALCHLPHLALLAIEYYFYFIKGDTGKAWFGFFSNAAPFTVLRNNNILIGTISIYFGFFVRNISFFALAFIATIIGTWQLWKYNRIIAVSVITALAVQVILSLLKLYPMVGSRYCFYFFPFVMFGLGKFIDQALVITKARREYIIGILIAISLVFSFVAIKKNIYFQNSDEFTNTNQSFFNGVNYLRNNIQPGDVILTNKAGWTHLVYLTDKANSGYFPESFGHYDFEGRKLYFQEKRTFWEYLVKENFYEFLKSIKTVSAEGGNIWFLVFGTSDYSIMTIYNCDYVQPYLKKTYYGRGTLIFQLDKKFFMENFFPPNAQVEACFANSKEPGMGGVFGNK